MRREIIDYLRDILDASRNAMRFVEGMSLESFTTDEKTIYAVIRALEIVGEAGKRIPKAVQQKYPDIPWREMAGMRDKVSHEYFGVNPRRVFDTVKQDLPSLCQGIEKMLEKMK